ncbi:hypothetical protein CR513_06224, partial [Mucuna pruriens]
MEDESSSKGSTLILGKPFLMRTRTKIDMHPRTLSMEFGDNMVQFSIFEAMKHPTKNHSCHSGLSTFSEFSDFANFAYVTDLADFECTCDGEVVEFIASQPPSPFIMQPPALELKPLPKHLKYAYLKDYQKLSDTIRGGSPTNEAAIEATKPHHS